MKKITTPIDIEEIESLSAGDMVSLSGIVYTGRDQAHKRMVESIKKGETLPFDPEGQAIFYVGPSPTKPGDIIGAAGPTTSYRMDDLTVPLLERGLKIMIGKGKRSDSVIEAMKKYKACYLVAIGGAGAYISNCIKSNEIIAYEDLDSEAVRKLYVEDMILTVCIDSRGESLYNK